MRPFSAVPAFAAIAVFVLFIELSISSAAADPDNAAPPPREGGIDYTKPFLYDGILPPDDPVQRLLGDGKCREALLLLRRMLALEGMAPRERAGRLRFAAQLEIECGSAKQAIRDVEASFETGVLSDIDKQETFYFLGRLYLGIEPPDYDKSIANLRNYLRLAHQPEPDAFFYLGQALAMKGECREALPHAEKAISLTEPPKENYHRLLLFCHVELKNHDEVVRLAKRMIELFGAKDEYLALLAFAYRETGRGRDAFLTQAQRYELGLLDTEGELVGIAELYQIHENPHRAARILEKEMKAGRVKRTAKNLEKLGNMWFLAREYDKARENLREAARLESGDDGGRGREIDLARDCFQDEDWECAERRLRSALTKGKLREPCKARILLAHALVNQERRAEAIAEFQRAANEKACAEEAEPWIQFLEMQERAERENEKIGKGTKRPERGRR